MHACDALFCPDVLCVIVADRSCLQHRGDMTVMFHIPHAGCAGEQLPVLYYKEGERLSELSNYMRDGS